MKLEKLLLQKKSAILDRWLQLILETYPADAQRFLKKQKDRFANPVRYTIAGETENLYKQLLQSVEAKSESLSASLDKIFRIRAVQDFCPSQAVAFIFLLKKVIKEELESE
ncbi:MAG: RsbRD N-terminal domain-containing protein, partial [Desulfatiglandales bacterium]|nr:RsbRD N-terminal domain-containing protein [Desulfatiglandales bacterium]